MRTSVNMVWAHERKVPLNQLPLPNTKDAPFIENIKWWRLLNPDISVNLYIQQIQYYDGVENTEELFNEVSLERLREALGPGVNVHLMDVDFYQASLSRIYDRLKDIPNWKYDDHYEYHDCIKSSIIEQTMCFLTQERAYIHAKVDLIRLLVLEHALNFGDDFACYCDCDIVFKQPLNDFFLQWPATPIMLFSKYSLTNGKNAYEHSYYENSYYGFPKNQLVSLDRLALNTAYEVVVYKSSGMRTFRSFTQQISDPLVLYAQKRTSLRLSMHYEIEKNSREMALQARPQFTPIAMSVHSNSCDDGNRLDGMTLPTHLELRLNMQLEKALQEKKIQKEHNAIILQRLQNNDKSLTTLTIYLNAHEIAYFCQILAKNHTLLKLTIIGGEVNNEGAQAFSDALQNNITLTHLNIENNRIDNQGAGYISKALKNNRVLQHLNLGNNQISNDGFERLADALKANETLTFLNIGGGALNSDGLVFLSEALEINRTLTHLSLRNSSLIVSLSSINQLQSALENNHALKVLDIENINSDKIENILSTVCYALRSNITLVEIRGIQKHDNFSKEIFYNLNRNRKILSILAREFGLLNKENLTPKINNCYFSVLSILSKNARKKDEIESFFICLNQMKNDCFLDAIYIFTYLKEHEKKAFFFGIFDSSSCDILRLFLAKATKEHASINREIIDAIITLLTHKKTVEKSKNTIKEMQKQLRKNDDLERLTNDVYFPNSITYAGMV